MVKESLENIIIQKYDTYLRGKHYRITKKFDINIIQKNNSYKKCSQNLEYNIKNNISANRTNTSINNLQINNSHQLPDIKCIHNDYYKIDNNYERIQKDTVRSLLKVISEIHKDYDDQARIIVNMVQNIPYDDEYIRNKRNKQPLRDLHTPYETLLKNKGICCETSSLLIYLLHELGYGVGEFHLPEENHVTAALKVKGAGYRNTGYALIECTTPTIIGYNPSDEDGLTKPRILTKLVDGKSFDNIEELQDVERYNQSIKYRHNFDFLNIPKKYQAQIPTNKNILEGINYDK